MSTPTLDGMTPEQLDELAERAKASANQQREAQAAEQKAKEERSWIDLGGNGKNSDVYRYNRLTKELQVKSSGCSWKLSMYHDEVKQLLSGGMAWNSIALAAKINEVGK